MSDSVSSSLARTLSVLDLFNENKQTLTAEEIVDVLAVSRPTGYRYVRILLNADLLQQVGNSLYALGPKIVVLDHYIRFSDPVLRVSRPLMQELAKKTGFDCITSGWFGNQVLDTHREYGAVPAHLLYGRGRPRPLFLGSAPKLILASFSSPQLRKVFDQHGEEAVAAGLPGDWPGFRKYFAAIRRAGHYLSVGELQSQYASVGAPIVSPKESLWGSLSIVFDKSRLSIIDTDKLTGLTIETAQAISTRIAMGADV